MWDSRSGRGTQFLELMSQDEDRSSNSLVDGLFYCSTASGILIALSFSKLRAYDYIFGVLNLLVLTLVKVKVEVCLMY